MCLKLNSDAIFIADSHFSSKTRVLLDYLSELLISPPSQLILMGDIAQVLLGNLQSSLLCNQELLSLLDQFQSTQIIWLEGNHDLFLSSIKKTGLLSNVDFIPRKKQPLVAEFKGKSYLLAHGDLFLNPSYELYIQSLTHIPSLLKMIDYLSGGEIYLELHKKLEDKPINKPSFHFFEFASKRIQNYRKNFAFSFDGIIEGHFHIGKKLEVQQTIYVALPSFYFSPQGIEIATILK